MGEKALREFDRIKAYFEEWKTCMDYEDMLNMQLLIEIVEELKKELVAEAER